MRWALGLKRGTECRSYRPCLGIALQTVRRFLHIHLTLHDSQRLWLGEALSLRKRDRWRAAVPGRRQANPGSVLNLQQKGEVMVGGWR